MKITSPSKRAVSLTFTLLMAGAAIAQPPPLGPFGPGPRGPIRRIPRRPLVELIVPPPPPPPIRRYRESGDSGSSTVTRVQRALKTRGYYEGGIDGDAGTGTRNAIRGFREDNGLDSSTRIDAALLEALGL